MDRSGLIHSSIVTGDLRGAIAPALAQGVAECFGLEAFYCEIDGEWYGFKQHGIGLFAGDVINWLPINDGVIRKFALLLAKTACTPPPEPQTFSPPSRPAPGETIGGGTR